MKIHFIGIGGIGISGLAMIYKQKGNLVQGSDAEESEITQELQKQGVKVFIDHRKANLQSSEVKPRRIGSRTSIEITAVPTVLPDLVIYSEAVPPENIELVEAKRLGIRCLSGAEALGELSREYYTIAISGMHGKSTTASMLAGILIKAGLDPTFLIGTKPGWRVGNSKYLVIEADDYQAKFLNYHPDILVLTNIEEEHMDFFQNLNHIIKIFGKYINQVKDYLIANTDDANVVKVLKELRIKNEKLKIISFSFEDRGAGELKKVLKVPGKHNVANALAALNAARVLGIDDKISFRALGEYKGVWRRFQESELKIKNFKVKIISDYAHHPTEIQATFQALQEKYGSPSAGSGQDPSASLRANSLGGAKRIWVVFQPHQYQRTFYLFKNFIKIFQTAKSKFGISKVILTDIYSVKGRESDAIKKKVDSKKLAAAIGKKEVEYIAQKNLVRYLKNVIPREKVEVLVVMGAGDIYKIIEQLSN